MRILCCIGCGESDSTRKLIGLKGREDVDEPRTPAGAQLRYCNQYFLNSQHLSNAPISLWSSTLYITSSLMLRLVGYNTVKRFTPALCRIFCVPFMAQVLRTCSVHISNILMFSNRDIQLEYMSHVKHDMINFLGTDVFNRLPDRI